ncbi:hypothetical protein GCM10009608_79260 [Pseudonocardia alaniniphila]
MLPGSLDPTWVSLDPAIIYRGIQNGSDQAVRLGGAVLGSPLAEQGGPPGPNDSGRQFGQFDRAEEGLNVVSRQRRTAGESPLAAIVESTIENAILRPAELTCRTAPLRYRTVQDRHPTA